MRIILVFIIGLSIISCRFSEKNSEFKSHLPGEFNAEDLIVKENPLNLLKGQVIYLPVYSNIPLHIDSVIFNMSAFVAIHNTDLKNEIQITKALYFDDKGKLVYDFLNKEVIKLGPLNTKDFFVPYEDKSGTGANFIIEWISDSLVVEPLIESVTISLKPNQSVAVLSRGKVVREIQ